MSSLPLTIVTSTGGWCSASQPWCSMIARMEFLNNSNSMWYRCDGTYTILMGMPFSVSVTAPTVHFNDILQWYCYIQIKWCVFGLQFSGYDTTQPDLNFRWKESASAKKLQYSLDMSMCTSQRYCANSSENEKLTGNEPRPLGQPPYRLNHYSAVL